jgi:hypothetical protein
VPPPVLAVLPDLGEFVEQAKATSVAEMKTVEKAPLYFMKAPCMYKWGPFGKKGQFALHQELRGCRPARHPGTAGVHRQELQTPSSLSGLAIRMGDHRQDLHAALALRVDKRSEADVTVR